MRHLIVLIKRELFDNLASSRYILMSILCVALCVTSIVLMSYDYERRLKRASLSDWALNKPASPLSQIARGTDEFVGRPLSPRTHGRYQVIAQIYYWAGEEHHIFDHFTTSDWHSAIQS